MARKSRRNKEEIAEDWCFICKDGGLLMVCDHKDCLKAYHPECVGKDGSFVERGNHFSCDWHLCFLCRKKSKFQCFCCPSSICSHCINVAEFALVRGNKGLCSNCLKLALLIEEGVNVDSDGGKIDFKDRDTYECLFLEYYEIIKEKQRLTSEHIRTAKNLLKGENYECDSDLNCVVDEEEGDEETEEVSDYDDFSDAEALIPRRKRKRYEQKLQNPTKRKVKTKKKEFIGWGSKVLLEFLDHIGKDTSKQLSQQNVISIVMEYCKEKQLFDRERKRKVLCDARLQSLLGRKSVHKNSIYKLLYAHFAENFDEIEEDELWFSSDDSDENTLVNNKSKRRPLSCANSQDKLVSEVQNSCFASIISENIKLVYLKRSLMEDLQKQPDDFDSKVVGSFVRVKPSKYDYLQKNSHLLLQVTGFERRSRNDKMDAEFLLQLSHMPGLVPISKLSDDNFSKEECEDLHHRMNNGLIKRPTVVELEYKAKILHQDIIKHWIARELKSLQGRIDQANEKGWRREFFEHMERKQQLESSSEQSRLLNEVPKVIADLEDPKALSENSYGDDEKRQNCQPDLAIIKSENTVPVGRDQNDRVLPENRKKLFEEHQLKELTTNVLVSSDDGGINNQPKQHHLSEASQPRQFQSVSVPDDKKQNQICASNLEQTSAENHKVAGSNDSAQDAGVNVRNQAEVNPESAIWHLAGPFGEKRVNLSMSSLKRWSQISSYASEVKVWRTGQSEEEAIPLADALCQMFPDT